MGVPKPSGACFGSEGENRSVTVVEKKGVNLGGGDVFCVSTANFGQDVGVGVLGRMWVCGLGGGLVNLGLASGWPVRCQTKLTGECWIHQVK